MQRRRLCKSCGSLHRSQILRPARNASRSDAGGDFVSDAGSGSPEGDNEHENDFLYALLSGRFDLLLLWLIRALVIGWFLYAGSLSALTGFAGKPAGTGACVSQVCLSCFALARKNHAELAATPLLRAR
jgi:hypothetical protein